MPTTTQSPKENKIQKDEEIREVRREVGALWREILQKLRSEVAVAKKKKEPLPEELVKMCKIASDQLRVDFRIDQLEPVTTPAAETPGDVAANATDDPLSEIRLHSEDAA